MGWTLIHNCILKKFFQISNVYLWKLCFILSSLWAPSITKTMGNPLSFFFSLSLSLSNTHTHSRYLCCSPQVFCHNWDLKQKNRISFEKKNLKKKFWKMNFFSEQGAPLSVWNVCLSKHKKLESLHYNHFFVYKLKPTCWLVLGKTQIFFYAKSVLVLQLCLENKSIHFLVDNTQPN